MGRRGARASLRRVFLQTAHSALHRVLRHVSRRPGLPPGDGRLRAPVRGIAEAALAGAPKGGLVIVQTRFVSGLAFSAIRNGRAVPLPIEITVSDNGPGIDPALRDHVFEPFVSSKPSGQGLGLSLVRKLVRDMNGNVSHDRDARAGLTNFRLHLPQAPDAA